VASETPAAAGLHPVGPARRTAVSPRRSRPSLSRVNGDWPVRKIAIDTRGCTHRARDADHTVCSRRAATQPNARLNFKIPCSRCARVSCLCQMQPPGTSVISSCANPPNPSCVTRPAGRRESRDFRCRRHQPVTQAPNDVVPPTQRKRCWSRDRRYRDPFDRSGKARCVPVVIHLQLRSSSRRACATSGRAGASAHLDVGRRGGPLACTSYDVTL